MSKTNPIDLRLPGHHCPKCGKLIDRLSDLNGDDLIGELSENMYSICICCGELLRNDYELEESLMY